MYEEKDEIEMGPLNDREKEILLQALQIGFHYGSTKSSLFLTNFVYKIKEDELKRKYGVVTNAFCKDGEELGRVSMDQTHNDLMEIYSILSECDWRS